MSSARLILVSAGLLIAAGSTARFALDESWAARSWPGTEGRITFARVAEKTRYISSGGGRMTRSTYYEPSISYRYAAGGAERRGSRIWSGHERDWDDRAGAEAFIAAYPMFARVRVHYDPQAPDRAYLVASRPAIGWLILAGFGLLLAGFGTRAKGRERRRPKATAS